MDINEAIDALDAQLVANGVELPQNQTPETTEAAPEAPAPESAKAAPITEDNVAPPEAEAPAAPDSTLLRDKLQALATPAAPQGPDPREAELAQLRQAVQALSANKVADPVAFLQQQTGLTPEQLIAQQQAPESLAQRALAEAQQARQEQDRLRAELTAKEQEAHFDVVRQGVTDFVTSQADEYKVVNTSGNQSLVFELMAQSLETDAPLSETQAAAQVESKLAAFINDHAALLGWTKPGEAPSPEDAPRNEESTTINPQTATASTAKSWDDMSFDEREREMLKLL